MPKLPQSKTIESAPLDLALTPEDLQGSEPSLPKSLEYKVPLITAIAIVIANMVGTGVFTSLGYQLITLKQPFVLIMLWVVGGAIALCGALSYAELAAALPRSGGEFYYLSRIFHPGVGFVAGWTSVTVGFAAPIALSAMALGDYGSQALTSQKEVGALIAGIPVNKETLALIAVVLITLAQLISLRTASLFQSLFTLAKMLVIAALIVAGLLITPHPQTISFLPQSGDTSLLFSSAFASSLFYVMYAYSGWNAATYITEEIADPVRNLPRALLGGTLSVMLLYVVLNGIFLYVAPMRDMVGVTTVAIPAATAIFGRTGARIVAGIICFGLIATISAMTWVGPRVAKAMGEQIYALRFLAATSASGVPHVAILVQALITLALMHLGTFDAVLKYIQFTLTLCSCLTVVGLFVLRIREPDLMRPYKVWGYPFTPSFFIICSLWMLYVNLQTSLWESLAGFGTMLAGLVLFYGSRFFQPIRINS